MTWTSDEQPWIRQQNDIGSSANMRRGAPSGALCYFCGEQTVKRSIGDISEDTGRVRLYCDNSGCDAREITVLVERDGQLARQRADVRALRELEGMNGRNRTLSKILQNTPSDDVRLAARRNHEPFSIEVP